MRFMTLAAFAGAIALNIGCGSKAPDECVAMLNCDKDLAAADSNYSASFGGLDDDAYGDGGSCYKGNKDACITACDAARTGMKAAADGLVTAGTLDAVPGTCE